MDSPVPTPVEKLVPGAGVNRPVPAPAPVLEGRPVVTGVRTHVPVPTPVNKGVAKMLGPNVGLNVGTWLGTRLRTDV